MKLPDLHGVIRRRILVNFRIDPEAMQSKLPPPFRVKTVENYAIGGVCLIRLEQMRFSCGCIPIGMASENAAHRVAVEWTEEGGEAKTGVYVPRRDTSSRLNAWSGGRVFPGDYKHATFAVMDEDGAIDFRMTSDDGQVSLQLVASETVDFPPESVFKNLECASHFFEAGNIGYSPNVEGTGFDGMELDTEMWDVCPLAVHEVASSYFSEPNFPPGSVAFDCALIMRDIAHAWRPTAAMSTCFHTA